jgi:hypothetical protein
MNRTNGSIMRRLGPLICGVAVLVPVILISGIAGCELKNGSNADTGTLAVTPVSATLNASVVTNVSLTASGGTAPYSWSVESSSLGTVVSSGSTATYTGYALTGLNFVVVTDASSNSVSATITQK